MKNQKLKSISSDILSSTAAFASLVSAAALLHKFELGTPKAIFAIVIPVVLAGASAILKLKQIHRFSETDSAKNATPIRPR